MNTPSELNEKISPQLIRLISQQLNNLHSDTDWLGQHLLREGFPIPDNQSIAILAEDKGEESPVFCIGIPVPLTENEGESILSVWTNTCAKLGIDNTNQEKLVVGCFDLLNELISNDPAVSNIAKIVGAYCIQKQLNAGIGLKEQARINGEHATNRTLKAHFSILRNKKLLMFESDIGSWQKISRTDHDV